MSHNYNYRNTTAAQTASTSWDAASDFGGWDNTHLAWEEEDGWGNSLTNSSNQKTPEKTFGESFFARMKSGFRAFRKTVAEKFGAGQSTINAGDAWRVATEIGVDMAPAVLSTFQTAGRAALAGAGVLDKKGQFSTMGTLKTAAVIAGGGGTLVVRGAALRVATDAGVRSEIIGLGDELLGQVAARSDKAAGIIATGRKITKNPLVQAGMKYGTKKAIGAAKRYRSSVERQPAIQQGRPSDPPGW